MDVGGATSYAFALYRPQDWHHELSIATDTGHLKNGRLGPWTIAGPLCFVDYVIARACPFA